MLHLVRTAFGWTKGGLIGTGAGVAALCLAIPAASAQNTRSAIEVCLDEGRSFATCLPTLSQVETFVDAERAGPNDRSSRLELAYGLGEFSLLSDGVDPQIVLFLVVRHRLDGTTVFTDVTEVGRVASFDDFTRDAPGRYRFSGAVFSEQRGCLVDMTYDVDATDYTVAIRAVAASPPPLRISQDEGTACR